MAKPTRFASTAALLVGTAVKPLLKAGAKIDLMPVFKDLTLKTFDPKKCQMALDAALKDHMAEDADPKHIAEVMHHLDGLKTADESVSEPQHKAMEAAAHGNSTLGIPETVGKEFVSKDTFPKSALDWLKGHMDAKAFDEFSATDEWPDEEKKAAAEDEEEEEPEEVTEGKEDVKQGAEDRTAKDKKFGKDKKLGKDRAKDTAMDKHAMDEAIKVACDATAKETAKAVRESMQALHEAATEVKPYIGEINAMAFDSGEAIKRHALKSLGVKEADKLHASALSTILGYQRKAGAHPIESNRRGGDMAMDSSAHADAVKMAPGLANIRIGA